MGLLEGKIAVITGGAGAIGRAEAMLFAREGAKLVVNDLGTAADGTGQDRAAATAVVDELRKAGAEAEASYDDVSTEAGARQLMATAVERFGQLDILVHSAGFALDRSLLKMDAESWTRVLGVHLDATFLCIREAARHMVARAEGGRIVTTAGLAGLQGAFGQANYAAAMAGIYGLTRAAAVELQKHKITVNGVAPVALTRLTAELPQMQGLEHLTAEHVAPVALYFASPLCRDRTGEVLGVAGSRLTRLRLVESAGKFKEGHEPWTAEEIAEHWDALCKL